ncbi:MAG: VWA domain-containing protein, partial [Gemmatimonadetes bacterium]|nr:VWA domain-containing protein [Gemmatimonadota bacterium]
MDQQQTKTRGVADIVFLIDVSGSMAPIIDALKRNIELFIDSLSSGEGNNVSPVRDWRAKAVGYRDFEADAEPFIDNPFVRDVTALKAQLAGLVAQGGGDEPESLLDALFRIANVGQTERGAQSEDPNQWRYR